MTHRRFRGGSSGRLTALLCALMMLVGLSMGAATADSNKPSTPDTARPESRTTGAPVSGARRTSGRKTRVLAARPTTRRRNTTAKAAVKATPKSTRTKAKKRAVIASPTDPCAGLSVVLLVPDGTVAKRAFPSWYAGALSGNDCATRHYVEYTPGADPAAETAEIVANLSDADAIVIGDLIGEPDLSTALPGALAARGVVYFDIFGLRSGRPPGYAFEFTASYPALLNGVLRYLRDFGDVTRVGIVSLTPVTEFPADILPVRFFQPAANTAEAFVAAVGQALGDGANSLILDGPAAPVGAAIKRIRELRYSGRIVSTTWSFADTSPAYDGVIFASYYAARALIPDDVRDAADEFIGGRVGFGFGEGYEAGYAAQYAMAQARGRAAAIPQILLELEGEGAYQHVGWADDGSLLNPYISLFSLTESGDSADSIGRRQVYG